MMIAALDSTRPSGTSLSTRTNRGRVVAVPARRTAVANLRSKPPKATFRNSHPLRIASAAGLAAFLLVVSCLDARPTFAFTSLAPAACSANRRPVAARTDPLNVHVSQHKHQLAVVDALAVEPTHIVSEGKATNEKGAAPTRTLNPTPVLFAAFQDLLFDKGNTESSSVAATTTAAALSAFALATVLMLSPLSADAAMSGGRIGGSFPSSRQSYSTPAPSSSYSRGYSSGYRSGSGSSIYIPRTPVYVDDLGFESNTIGTLMYLGLLGWHVLYLIRYAASAVYDKVKSFTSALDDRFALGAAASALGPGISVVQVSVALEVPKRDDPSSILSILDRLASTARTDSRVGIQNLTSQVALELLRRKSSIVSASASSQHYKSRDQALRNYNSASIDERAKFEHETVNQYGGVDYGVSFFSLAPFQAAADGQATMAVVTLLLAIDGDSTKLPNINSMASVEEALRKIAIDAKVDTCLQSAEILWTPTDRSETLTLRDVVADYPQLRSI